MLRIGVIFLTQLLLSTLVSQVNHALSGLHVYLFVGGLFVTYAALALPLRDGIIVSFLGGLLCDANVPLPPGLSRLALAFAHSHALLFVCAHAIVFQLRARMPRHETAPRVMVALFVNLGVFLVFSSVHITRSPAPAQILPRIVIDLASSQIFLALIAPWFFALQTRVLALARVERENLANPP